MAGASPHPAAKGGKKALDAKDDAIQKAGKVGLWSKADAQTYFTNVQITPGNKGKR